MERLTVYNRNISLTTLKQELFPYIQYITQGKLRHNFFEEKEENYLNIIKRI